MGNTDWVDVQGSHDLAWKTLKHLNMQTCVFQGDQILEHGTYNPANAKPNAFKTQPLKHLPLAQHEWVENLVIHKAIDCTWDNSSIIKIVNYKKKAAKMTKEWCDLQSPSFLSKKTIHGSTKGLRNSKKTELSTMN
jgi:hypothetical protein